MTNMNSNFGLQLLMTHPNLSCPTNSSIHMSPTDEPGIKDAYRSPLILSDFSDNDMDISVNQVYQCTEASDEEENHALVPVMVKSKSPIASEVNLVTVFDRLKLKRPSESCESGPSLKLHKYEMLGCIMRKPLEPLIDNHAIAARTRSQRGTLIKGSGRNRNGSKVILNSLACGSDENLIEVLVNHLSVGNAWLMEMAVVAGLIPPHGINEANILELSRSRSCLD